MEVFEAMARYPWLEEMLRELPREALEQIKIRRYKPREIMIEHCEDNYYTFIILEGVCCTSQSLENGTPFVLRKATIGDVVGFSGIYQTEPDYAARVSSHISSHISARTAVIAAILPRPLVQGCFGTYPGFSVQISRRVIDRLQSLVSLLSKCNNYPSYLSLVTYLGYNYLFYAKSYPARYTGPVRIVESRQNIADFLGIDVRSVQRLLGRMKEEGLVSISSRSIYIDQQQYQALQAVRYHWSLQ